MSLVNENKKRTCENLDLDDESVKNVTKQQKTETNSCQIVAHTIKQLYGSTYKCTDIDQNMWYVFKNNKWIRSGSHQIKELICTHILDIISANDNIFYTKLQNNEYFNELIKCCAYEFHDATFEDKLDSNPYLLGFENGVYDLTCGFRTATPDDLISITTGYDYVEYNMNSPEVIQLENYFTCAQPDPETREYMLKSLASFLDGKTNFIDQKIFMWSGGENNFKSTTLQLLHDTLGEYADHIPSSCVTGTSKYTNSCMATPELVELKGKRFVDIQEPEQCDQINVGKLMQLTGGDKIMARPLYGKEIEFKPQFKLILCSSEPLEIPTNDIGTWRRLKVISWESRFAEDLEIPMLVQPFMWLLLNKYYPKYIAHGLVEPVKVVEHTNRKRYYDADADVYHNFLEEFTESKKFTELTELMHYDAYKYKLSVTELYQIYKMWYGEVYCSAHPPPMRELVNYLGKKGYEIRLGLILGMKLKE